MSATQVAQDLAHLCQRSAIAFFFMAKKIDPEVAAERMCARGWNPDGEYPGALKPWPGTCAMCGKPGAPKYANVVTSGQGPCRPCSGAQKRTEEEAGAIMAERGLAPRGSYPGSNKPWASLCSVCGGETSPTLTSVRKALKQGQRKGCDLCRRNGAIRPEDAEDMLRVVGAEPLDPFPGVKKPWRSRCLNEWCRREVKPAFDSIKHAKTGPCKYCGGYGIRGIDAALVYLMEHPVLNAAKIGIAKVGSDRVEEHESTGWKTVIIVETLGHQARAVEGAVLDLWRNDLGLAYGAAAADMPFAGYTETVSLADRSIAEVQSDLARAVVAVLGEDGEDAAEPGASVGRAGGDCPGLPTRSTIAPAERYGEQGARATAPGRAAGIRGPVQRQASAVGDGALGWR